MLQIGSEILWTDILSQQSKHSNPCFSTREHPIWYGLGAHEQASKHVLDTRPISVLKTLLSVLETLHGLLLCQVLETNLHGNTLPTNCHL